MRASSWLVLVVSLAPLACSSSSTSPATPDGGGGASNGKDAGDAGTKRHDSGRPSSDAPVAESGPADAGITGFDGPVPPPADAGIPADAHSLGDANGTPRTYTITNHCEGTVWAAVLPKTTFPNGIVEMAPGDSFQVGVDNGWSGRIWGKTGCTTSGGNTTCESDGIPASLAELTLTNTPDGGLDFYDVSLVDGFNLPIELLAVGHTPNPSEPYNCGNPSCVVNLNATCPAVLQDKVDGSVIACANDECKVLANNDASSPDCIYPNQYTKFFKTPCPTAYSFPYDDPTSTFTCKGVNSYAVVFCP